MLGHVNIIVGTEMWFEPSRTLFFLPMLEVVEAVKDVFSFRVLLNFVNFIWTLNCHELLFKNFRLSFPLLAKLNVSNSYYKVV